MQPILIVLGGYHYNLKYEHSLILLLKILNFIFRLLIFYLFLNNLILSVLYNPQFID